MLFLDLFIFLMKSPSISIKRILLAVALLGISSLSAQEIVPTNLTASDTASLAAPTFTKTSIAISVGDLLALEDAPANQGQDAAFIKEHFPMTAQLYTSVLNTVAHGGYDEEFHLYNEKVASLITRSTDTEGLNHYTVTEGQEGAFLGYLKCLDSSKLKDALCKDQNGDYSINSEVDTDTQSYLFIKLGSTDTSPAEEGLTDADNQYYAWSEAPREDGTKANYYWLNTAAFSDTEHPDQPINHYTNGELWVSLPKMDPSDTYSWYATGDHQYGITTGTKTTPLQAPSVKAPIAPTLQVMQSAAPAPEEDRTWTQWWNSFNHDQKMALLETPTVPILAACLYTTAATVNPLLTFMGAGMVAFEAYQLASAFWS